jgi:hypothetical protein
VNLQTRVNRTGGGSDTAWTATPTLVG